MTLTGSDSKTERDREKYRDIERKERDRDSPIASDRESLEFSTSETEKRTLIQQKKEGVVSGKEKERERKR